MREQKDIKVYRSILHYGRRENKCALAQLLQ